MKRLGLLLLGMVAVATPLFSQYYKVYFFPPYGGPGIAINSSGQVAADFYNGNDWAYLGTAQGGFRYLGGLGDTGSQPSAISDSGDVVGTSSVGTDPYAYNGFLWTPAGGMQDIGAGPLGGTSFANAVNDSGDVAALSCNGTNCLVFFWSQATGSINVGALPGEDDSSASLLNNNGEIAGTSSSSSTISGFTWTLDTGIQPLASFGGAVTRPLSINDGGQIVGYSTYPDGTEHAALWSASGAVQDLGVFPGDTTSTALFTNSNGDVAGYSYHVSGKKSVGQNFFWTAQTGMNAMGAAYPLFTVVGLNNRDQMLLQSNDGCYLWTPSQTLLKITGCNGGGPFGFNDAGVLLAERGNGNDFGVYWIIASPSMHVGMTSSPNPSQFGQSVTFTANVSSIVGPPPDGELVNFLEGSKIVCSGTLTSGAASCATAALKSGNDNIRAQYVGDGNYFESSSAKLVQVVNP